VSSVEAADAELGLIEKAKGVLAGGTDIRHTREAWASALEALVR
jgi:hypothetical protein